MFKTIKKFNELTSTNSKLLEDINSIELPAVYFTRKQTKGKGRIGNKWATSDQGLFCSFAIKPNSYIFELFHYPYLIALIINQFLMSFKIYSKIKWPNDLLVNQKKISGILIESHENRLIIGIGINVNEERDVFLHQNLNATSMMIELNQAFIVTDLYTHLLKCIETNFDLYSMQPQKIIEDWKKYTIHQNELVTCRVGTKVIVGEFTDIGEKGELILKQKEKRITVYAGEIIES